MVDHNDHTDHTDRTDRTLTHLSLWRIFDKRLYKLLWSYVVESLLYNNIIMMHMSVCVFDVLCLVESGAVQTCFGVRQLRLTQLAT